MKKSLIGLILFFLVLILLLNGCTQKSGNIDTQLYVCSNGDKVSNPNLCPTQNNPQNNLASTVCPYECCDNPKYDYKGCNVEQSCVNNTCVDNLIPKINVSIDACETSMNISQGLGEVTDVFLTIENYGNTEAKNVDVSATANDVGQLLNISHGIISILPANQSKKIKLTIDTDSKIQTIVSVTFKCPNCSQKSVTVTDPACYYNREKIANIIKQYGPVVAGLI